MWARIPGPARCGGGDSEDTGVGIGLQLSSDQMASVAESVMLRHHHHHHHRSGGSSAGGADGTTAMIERVSVMLAQNPHTFGFQDSSETEDWSVDGDGRDSRPKICVRAAVWHGHSASGRSQSAIDARSRQQPHAAAVAPGSVIGALRPQQPELQAAAVAKTAVTGTSRSRYFFESTFLMNLQVSRAKEVDAFAPVEACAPAPAAPTVDTAARSVVPGPLCLLVFRCAESALTQRAPVRTRAVGGHRDLLEASPLPPPPVAAPGCSCAICQTDPMPLMPPPIMPKSRHLGGSSAARGSLHRRRRDDRGDANSDLEESGEHPVGDDGRQLWQRQRRQRRLPEVPTDTGRTTAALRSMGRHLSSFFCTGGGVCSHSDAQTAGLASVVSAEPEDWHTAGACETARCRVETARSLTEPAGPPLRRAALAAEGAEAGTARDGRRSEPSSPPPKPRGPPKRGPNASLPSCSSNSVSGVEPTEHRRPPQHPHHHRRHQRHHHRSQHHRRQQRIRRGSPDVNSSLMASRRCSRFASSPSDELAGPKDAPVAAAAAASAVPTCGFECLMRTLDRARQRYGNPAKAPAAADFRGSEAEDADEEDDNWLDGNQSNVEGSCGCVCCNGCGCCDGANSWGRGQCDAAESEAVSFLVASVDLGAESLLVEDATRRQPQRQQQRQHEADLIDSVAQSLLTLSKGLETCLHRIHSTVSELQSGSDCW